LRPNKTIDRNGLRWAYTGESRCGCWAVFTIDKPKDNSRPYQAVPFRSPSQAQVTCTNPQQTAIPVTIKLAHREPVEFDPAKRRWRYGPTQGTKRVDNARGKSFVPHHLVEQEWRPGAGSDPWPAYCEVEASQARGFWVLEAEGEKCADIIRAGGRVAISQPGHAHKVEQIKDRYQRLVGAGVQGIVYLEDNDEQGRKRSSDSAEAATAVGLPLLVLPAARVWPGLPEKGSIDDALGTAADRVAEIEAAISSVLEHQGEPQKDHPGQVEQLDALLGPEQEGRLRKPPKDLLTQVVEAARQPEAQAQPTGEAQRGQAKGFIEETAALRRALDEGLRAIDAMPDVAMRSVGLVQLRRNLGLQEKDFLALVHQLAEHQEDAPPEDFEALLSYADSISAEPIIEDLLAVGLTLLAGEGGAGKSSVGYQVVEAVTTGGKVAGQFQAKKAPCLVVQLDESVKDANVKWRLMGFAPDKALIHFMWRFNPMMFPELRAKVQEKGIKVVILDSLLKVAGGSISPKDAEFGLLIYRLNQLAAELGIAIICVHHLVKADKTKKRAEVTKEDIYGSAYVFNGAADVWGYWSFREDGNPDPLYALKVLKNRSSLVEVNTTYEFEGSEEDHRIAFRGMANRTITLDEIKTHRERVRAFLLSRPGTVFTAKQVNDHTGVGSAAYAKKLLTELYQARVGVDRKRLPSTGGRPPYGYFGSEGSSLQPRARISLLPKQSPLPSLSLHSLSVGEGSKGVAKAPEGGDFVSLEPQGNTREEPGHGDSHAREAGRPWTENLGPESIDQWRAA
jgi:hypothetical protein